MFSRLIVVRLKAAEKALKGGRLDEAYRLATAPDLRERRRGAALLKKLTDKLIERARNHFAEERFTEALHDLDKAEAGGFRLDDIGELRAHIRTVADEVARQERSQRRRIEQAKDRVERGSLDAGRRLLAEAQPDDVEARGLAERVDKRRRDAVEAFGQVEKMIKQQQIPAALERFQKIRHLDPHAAEAVALETTLCARVVAAAMGAFEEGRINRAIEELGRLGSIGRAFPDRRDAEEMLALARKASRAMDTGDFEETRRVLLRLQRLRPKVAWLNKTVTQLEKLDGLLTDLYGGPLGEHARSATAKSAEQGPHEDLRATVLLRNRAPVGAPLPEHLLLLVDGGGSYLLVRKDRVSIGRSITQNAPDIPIQSDLAERHAEIARVDDDYFLFSPHDVMVDGRPTRHQLLRPGNRIVLSRNAKFAFRAPHRQSPSGIIELSSSTKMPGDVRRVILFKRTAVIGYGKNVHITCNTAEQDLLLFERGGQLWIRPHRAGRVDTEARPLEIGKQLMMANVSFVVQPFEAARLGPSI